MKTSFLLIQALVAGCLFGAESPADRYGQSTRENWPGKITDDRQLIDDAKREQPTLKNLSFDPAKYDRFGGVRAGGKFRATGFFRMEKVDGRHWFVTPEGHLFFLIGADAVNWNESGYASPLNANGKVRDVFTELPDRAEFPEAYLRPGKVNFLAANLKRKYGAAMSDAVGKINLARLLKWGFNSTAKWGWGVSIGLPYIEDSHVRGATRIARSIDMYAPNFSSEAEKTAQALAARRKNDPMLIAYSTENENGWSEDTVEAFLRETKKSYAKEAFLDFLASKRQGDFSKVAALFGRPAADRETLIRSRLNIAQIPAGEIREFVLVSSRRYHKILRDSFRKYDPNHMVMGAAHCPKQSIEWVLGAAEHVDFLGINTYGLTLGWLERGLSRLRNADTPFAVLEFGFVCAGRGFLPYSGLTTMIDERSRGLGYRYFTENIAVEPLCVGFGYFLYYDQPTTRRSLPNGENFNFGLVSQQDQPYPKMLGEVKKANADLFNLHAGKAVPFTMKDPRELLDRRKSRNLTELFLPGSMPSMVVVDVSAPHHFKGVAARLKIEENLIPGPGVWPVGVLGSGDGQRFTGFRLTVFLWEGLRTQTPANYITVEESFDNVNFTPVKLRAKLTTPAKFNAYEVSPAGELKRGTMFLRISFAVQHAKRSWAVQLGTIELDK